MMVGYVHNVPMVVRLVFSLVVAYLVYSRITSIMITVCNVLQIVCSVMMAQHAPAVLQVF